jgi:Abortive infection alpha
VAENIIPISDEQAKLGQEILKTLRGLGSFIEKALASTPEDLIAYFGGDWLRVRRAENLARLFEEARRRLADWNVQEPVPASLSIALPILQRAADEDREELVDLWARLLANAMDPNINNVRQSFIELVNKLDPVDAMFSGLSIN